LGSQTLVYGLSSIVPKFLSYLLNPLYAYNFASMELGKITILYTYVIFLNIILTYGLETGFFYFSRKEGNSSKIFGTSFYSLLATTSFFVFIALFYLDTIAKLLQFSDNPNYIFWFIFIIGFDTLSAIPFAKLRFQNKAFRFAFLKLLGVTLNVILNFVCIWLIPLLNRKFGLSIFGSNYQPDIEVIFICNFISSFFVLLLLLPSIFKDKPQFDFSLLKRMLIYSLPLMIAGLAGNINDTVDRIFLQYLLPKNVDALAEIGIYGANIKLAVLMVLFVQMFKFAAEPFFFNRKTSEDQNQVLADVTKYFILFGLLIFLGVMSYIDILKYYVGPEELWAGLKIVPIYLLANLMLGVYFNLSFWYKLSGKTYYGLLIMLCGAGLAIVLNIILIPRFSYFGSAIIHLVTNTAMTVLSYYLSRRYNPVNYQFKIIFGYVALAMVVFVVAYFINTPNIYINLVKNTFALILFALYLEKKEHLFSLFIRK